MAWHGGDSGTSNRWARATNACSRKAPLHTGAKGLGIAHSAAPTQPHAAPGSPQLIRVAHLVLEQGGGQGRGRDGRVYSGGHACNGGLIHLVKQLVQIRLPKKARPRGYNEGVGQWGREGVGQSGREGVGQWGREGGARTGGGTKDQGSEEAKTRG